MGGDSDFYSHKNGGVGKIGGVVLKSVWEGHMTYFYTNPFKYYASLSVWCCEVTAVST